MKKNTEVRVLRPTRRVLRLSVHTAQARATKEAKEQDQESLFCVHGQLVYEGPSVARAGRIGDSAQSSSRLPRIDGRFIRALGAVKCREKRIARTRDDSHGRKCEHGSDADQCRCDLVTS